MVSRLLFLREDELSRLLPFFGLYLLLFAALTLADGLSLSLFVQQVGAARLPLFYGLTALANLLLIGIYLGFADRISSPKMFAIIITGMSVLFLGCWAAMRWSDAHIASRGALFVGREVASTLVLLHFGTYLQDYFTRQELTRTLPIVYAGGRLGGICGGWLLSRSVATLPILDVPLLVALLTTASLAGMTWIAWSRDKVEVPEDLHSDQDVAVTKGDQAQVESDACRSISGFLRFVVISPLMFWTTVTSLVFMVCRWILNLQYNSFFEAHFSSDVAMAEFLGRYAQVALTLSLIIQLVLFGRLVQWLGIKGVHLLYGTLLCGGLLANLLPLTMAGAVYGRLVESELRFAIRNPVAQLMTNKFSKRLRIRVRAWTFGFLTPAATLATSVTLVTLLGFRMAPLIPMLGATAGLVYLGTSWGLFRSLSRAQSAKQLQDA